MELAAGERIEAAAEAVWDRIATEDFMVEALQALGLDLERVAGAPPGLCEGAAWTSSVAHSLFDGTVRIDVTEVVAPQRIVLSTEAAGITGAVLVILKELGPDACRLRVVTELAPKGLVGRLALAAIRVAEGKAKERYRLAVRRAARHVEQDLGRLPG